MTDLQAGAFHDANRQSHELMIEAVCNYIERVLLVTLSDHDKDKISDALEHTPIQPYSSHCPFRAWFYIALRDRLRPSLLLT